MPKLKALIFDVDGTLADTERDGHRIAFNLAFQEAGLDWDWTVALYGELLEVTGGKERIKRYIDHYLQGFQSPGDETEFIAQLHASKTRHYLELLHQGNIPLRPGVERLLNEARDKGLRLSIATTTTPENVTWLLKSTLGEAALDWFEVIAAGDIVPAKKPAPDIFDYAIEQMKLSADDCIAFEDSGNGILSSTGAGLRTIVTINDYTKDHDFTDALLVLDQFGEPDSPANVMQGNLNNKTCLDIEAIIQLAEA